MFRLGSQKLSDQKHLAEYTVDRIQVNLTPVRYGINSCKPSSLSIVAEQFIAPYRLGLTATIEREDDLHELIPYLTGGVVFRLGSQKLSDQKYLAEYTVDRIQVKPNLYGAMNCSAMRRYPGAGRWCTSSKIISLNWFPIEDARR